MGYDDSQSRVRITHMPLRSLIMARRRKWIFNDSRKDLNWGKFDPSGGCLTNWPYSRRTGSGHYPLGK